MPTKDELIGDLRKDKLYSNTEVAHMIRSVRNQNAPTKLKKGDVIIVNTGKYKNRPAVIVKVLEEVVVAIPLSSTEDEINLSTGKSRFWGDSYFSKYLVSVKISDALDKFAGVYDNPRAINKAISLIKEYVNQI